MTLDRSAPISADATASVAPPAVELIDATELADRLARGERVTVLDLREDVAWGIDAPSVRTRQLDYASALSAPAELARELDGSVAVVCNRGISAQSVARALRARGVDAVAVRDGMRGWIHALQARPVELGVDGLAVVQVQRPGRGCLSYLLLAGDRALVVDPAPDPDFYLELADELGGRITDVFDTHLHADHLSGARALSERAGAALRLPVGALERGVAYADEVTALADGDTVPLGGVEVRALALPGHTTDMTGLLLADRALVSGDSLFVDGLARPDLQQVDPAGARAMARQLHATLHERVLALGDDVVVLPGHTHPRVNSAPVVASLGEIRRNVPELAIDDAAQFADVLLRDMPPRPANYETIIAVNSGRHPFDPALETGGNSCSTR